MSCIHWILWILSNPPEEMSKRATFVPRLIKGKQLPQIERGCKQLGFHLFMNHPLPYM